MRCMGSELVVLGFILLCSCLPGLQKVSGKTAVTHLPGFAGRLPFELETGYVAVDDAEGVNLFYYFVKSERSPARDPLLFWIIGGPGCSGIAALAYEIGPLGFDIEAYEVGQFPSLIYRKDSWTRVSNIIFIDAPAGSGFSYSVSSEKNEWAETKLSHRLDAFIRKWLLDHPEFISHPFFLGGDSYGGKMAPILAERLLSGNGEGEVPVVNFKGYVIGNPATGDHRIDRGFKVPWSYGLGLISKELYEAAKMSCNGDYFTPRNTECAKLLDAVEEDLSGLYMENVLEPSCDPHQANHRSLGELDTSTLRSLKFPASGCRSEGYFALKEWMNNAQVQEALGGAKSWTGDWTRCRDDLRRQFLAEIPSVISLHENITSRGFRVLVYSGDHDMLTPFVGTQTWIRSLNYPVTDEWRPWWVDGQIAGYTRTYANNLTFATVKGAGHAAPEYKPKECLAMFKRWVSGQAI